MGYIFYRKSQRGGRTGSTYDFDIAKDINVVTKPKLGYNLQS